MNIDNIITILFLLIFIVGPLIKKIAEALSEQPKKAPPKRNSMEDVKEYLERMRNQAPSPERVRPETSSVPQGYQAPASRPYKGSGKEKQVAAKKKDAKVAAYAAQEAFCAVPEPVKAAIEEKHAPHATVVHTAPTKNFLHDFMADTKFSDVQKAIVLTEIFKEPLSERLSP